MPRIEIKPVVGVIVILIALLSCYGIYRGMASLNDEAFYRGFNTGTRVQKMFDDQKSGATNPKNNSEFNPGIEI